MAFILPINFFFLTFLYFFILPTQTLSCWRSAFLSACVVWGAVVTATTELLSVFNAINFGLLVACWGLGNLAMAGFLFRFIRQPNISNRLNYSEIDRFSSFLLAIIALICGIIFLRALNYPPNNWDSMTYHMSRVMHWTQNQSLAFYPSHISRQLHSNPWAEYAILHFQILSGGDRCANLIQWFSMTGSAAGVSLIAKQLGANLRAQIFSSVVSITIPMGILQGSTTQNDHVVSFWLVSSILFLFLFRKDQRLVFALLAGGSLGLAILTKGTAYLYALPFIIWLGMSIILKLRFKFWKFASIIIIIAFVLNFGHYHRNFTLYGNPIGPGQEGPHYKVTNDAYSFLFLVSNIVRNIGLHTGTPIQQLNSITEKGISALHQQIGVEINAPETTWWGTKFHVPMLSIHEDSAGNPLHLFLLFSALIIFMCSRRLKESKDLKGYLIAVLTTFLLFCFIIKWMPWHSRLHLPFFILSSTFLGIILSKINKHTVGNFVVVILLLVSSLWILYNRSHPYPGINAIDYPKRVHRYFINRPDLLEPYAGAVKFLESQKYCSKVGLLLGPDDWEYPFWALVRNSSSNTIQFKHVNVNNISSRLDGNDFIPCAVLSTAPVGDKELIIKNNRYLQEWSLNTVTVFLKSK